MANPPPENGDRSGLDPGAAQINDPPSKAIADHGTPEFAAVDPFGVAVFEDELAQILGWANAPRQPTSTQAALTDVERLALSLVDTFGPTWSRRLAHQLLIVAGEVSGYG